MIRVVLILMFGLGGVGALWTAPPGEPGAAEPRTAHAPASTHTAADLHLV